jgi:hypothetical protein
VGERVLSEGGLNRALLARQHAATKRELAAEADRLAGFHA